MLALQCRILLDSSSAALVQSTDIATAATILTPLTTIMVDSVLLFRVGVVLPYYSTPRRTWLAVFTPLILLKIARIICIISFGVKLTGEPDPTTHETPLKDTFSAPEIKACFVLQLLDCG